MSSKGVSGIPNSAPGGQFGTSDKNVVALKIKPKRHDFLIEKDSVPYVERHMNVTGG